MHRTGPQRALDRAAVRIAWARARARGITGRRARSAENLALMRRIDEQYLRTPFYGSRKMAEVLGVNRKRVQRLMRVMGIEAIYPKRRTTWPGAGHKIYPYLLRNVEVTRPDQVWASDITYVPLRHGFLYLVAVMDWYSRYVLSWRLSNTLTGSFCLEALDEALVAGRAGDLQQRSREPVHGHGVHVAIGIARHSDQHGWPRPSDRQRVHRAAVAEREVRGSVPARLHRRLARRSLAGRVLPLLQRRANPPGAGLPHAGGGLSRSRLKRRAAAGRKTN